MANATSLNVDQRQDESGQGESRQTEGSRVGEFAVRRPVETGLEFTTKGSEAHLWVIGSNMCQWVTAVVIRCPLLGGVAIVSVIESAGAVGILFEAWATL